MVKNIVKVIAILFFLAGGIWFLQGINVLPGSFMTGDPQWAHQRWDHHGCQRGSILVRES